MAFRKQHSGAPEGFFAAEAAGLTWLAKAGGARTVEVLGVGDDWIELERLEAARPTIEDAEQLGRSLARTHAAGAPAFGCKPEGWDGATFIGQQEMTCVPASDWGVFYVRQRVLPYVRRAQDRGHLTADDVRVVEAACIEVRSGAFDTNIAPARIHGDLWNGNVLWTPTGAVLIDPAAHGGHPETDLAMLALFGAPWLDRILGAYAEVGDLVDGWRERVPVHQLHPLAVHAASHGPSYGRQLVECARQVLQLS